MKIAFVNDFLPETGIGNYAFSVFEEMKKSIDIEMLYLDCDEDVRKEIPGVKTISKTTKFPFLNKSINNFFFFPKKIPQGYGLYHLSNQYLSNIALERKPCIISCMDMIPFAFDKGYNPIVSFFWRKQMAHLDKAEKIIAISEFTKKEMERILKIPAEKISAIPLGFNQKLFQPRQKEIARKQLGMPKDDIVFLNVGSEDERKNLETALKAFAAFASDFPNAKLLRVGEGRKQSRALIESLGMEKKAQYLQGVSPQRLALLYNAADALLFCSTYEGFGLPLVEAMASGLPVITNNSSSIPEVVGNAAIFANDAFSETELKELMAKVLEESTRKRLSEAGLERAARFTWKNCAEKTISLYKEVLG